MSGELLSSKVVVVEEEPKVRGIPSAPTSVAGAVGVTERGPIGQAVPCTTFDEFVATFGGFTPDSDLAPAAMGYFENGGSELWAVRTAHYLDIMNPASTTAVRASGMVLAGGGPTPAVLTGLAAGPFALLVGERLVFELNEPAGGSTTLEVVFIGTRASAMAATAAPYALADGDTLRVLLDGGTEQLIVFSAAEFTDITQAQASEVAAAINRQIGNGHAMAAPDRVQLSSDTVGSASRLQIRGGSASGAFSFPSDMHEGQGNVPNLARVDVLQVRDLVEAATPAVRVFSSAGGTLEFRTVATGASASIRALNATAAAFGLDTSMHTGSAIGGAGVLRTEGKDPGSYGNRLELEVRPATSGSPDAFDLLVVQDGVYRESFADVSMRAADARYAERVVNDARTGSRLVRVIDQLVAGGLPPSPQVLALRGGGDGLVGLDDDDFIGSSVGKTGLHALDAVQALSVLLVPGRATPAVHGAMAHYCEIVRDGMVFAVLDPPANQSAADMVRYVGTVARIENLTEYAAIYWPRVKVLNPQKSVFGSADQIVVPPSGIIAGVYARTDAGRPGGVYDPPAGIEAGRMFGVLGFETDEALEEKKRDLVYPHRINPLTTGTGLPRYIDGSRTLKGDGNFPYVAERRGVIFIERSLKRGLEFARHKNNTEGLRAQVRRTSYAFLLTQMNNGAFRSREPAKAFFVDVSDKLNTPAVIFAGQLIARIGLATNKPAEFVILRISQDTLAFDAELAA